MHCYQPISNLSVISKLLKRLVARQLLDYHRAVKLLPELQSAYRAFHSTKTAVLKVLADILLALNTGELYQRFLIHPHSAAFDTVDHATLLRRLETSYGIGSTVLGWFASYLSGRIQTVRCGMSASDASAVLCGVPQLHEDRSLDRFCSYSTLRTLLRLIKRHNLRPHMYADDTQIYGFCRPTAAS